MAAIRFSSFAAQLLLSWVPLLACGQVLAAPNPAPCRSHIDMQLEQGLKEIGDNKPARSGVYDIELPADRREYGKLNKMAILTVKVFSRDKSDLPISQIGVVHPGDSSVQVLPSIFPKSPVKTLPDDSPFTAKFGPYVQTIYLFVPVRLLRDQGTLAVRFKNQLNVLELGKFPIEFPKKLAFLGKDRDPREKANQLPDPKLVIAMLSREVCAR
jgi:hypothetical protein